MSCSRYVAHLTKKKYLNKRYVFFQVAPLSLPLRKFLRPPCYYWLYEIKKNGVGLATNGITFILNLIKIHPALQRAGTVSPTCTLLMHTLFWATRDLARNTDVCVRMLIHINCWQNCCPIKLMFPKVSCGWAVASWDATVRTHTSTY
jgi:hypothetical protein